MTAGTTLIAGDIPNITETQVTNLTGDLAALTTSIGNEVTRATGAESVLNGQILAETTRAEGAETAETSRATAAEALKANLAGGNTFTTGSQILAASTNAYSSLNIPEGGAAPSSPLVGDIFTVTGNTHLNYQAGASDTEQIAFLSDITSSNSSLLGADNTWTGTNTFNNPIVGTITGNITETQVTNLTGDLAALTTSIGNEVTRATGAESVLNGQILAETTRAEGAETAETSRATAAEALKANLAGGNTFTTGSQILAASTNAYSSLNIPEGGAAPSSPLVGDIFTVTGNTHLNYQAGASDTEQIAFLSDITSSNSSLLGADNT